MAHTTHILALQREPHHHSRFNPREGERVVLSPLCGGTGEGVHEYALEELLTTGDTLAAHVTCPACIASYRATHVAPPAHVWITRCGCTPRGLQAVPYDRDGDGVATACRRCGDYLTIEVVATDLRARIDQELAEEQARLDDEAWHAEREREKGRVL